MRANSAGATVNSASLGSTPEEYGRILRDETARWRQVIAASGVSLE